MSTRKITLIASIAALYVILTVNPSIFCDLIWSCAVSNLRNINSTALSYSLCDSRFVLGTIDCQFL